MWFSTTLVLTQGLLLVHLSLVSCAGQWGRKSFPSRQSESVMSASEVASKYGGKMSMNGGDDDFERAIKAVKQQPNYMSSAKDYRLQTYDPASVMTASQVASKYGGIMSTMRGGDDIGRAIRALKQQTNYMPSANDDYRMPTYDPARSTSNDLLQKMKTMQWGGRPNSLNPSRSTIAPSQSYPFSSQPSFSSTPSERPAPQSFSPFAPKPSKRSAPQSFSPFAPRPSERKSTPLASPYAPSSSSYKSTDSGFSLFGQNPSDGESTSGFSLYFGPKPSDGKSTPLSGSTSTQSQPSSSPNLFGSPSNRAQPQPSLNSGAQKYSPKQTVTPSTVTPTANNNQYKFAPDGRRLAGRQTLEWPKLGAPLNTSDAGLQLGDAFKGILLPQAFIDILKRSFSQNAESGDEFGHFQKRTFQIKFPPGGEKYCDVDLVAKAVREAQGDDDDYDNPDPWTQESIYSDEVLELNKRLHNEYRAKHYADPLEYMPEIHPVAHAYAKYLAHIVSTKGRKYFDHNYDVLKERKWGENLYTEDSPFDGKSPAKIVKSAIDGWYEEINRFRYWGQKNANVTHPLTGHFTCLVWRSTKRMGLGIAKYRNHQKNKTQYAVVVDYDPQGNEPDEYAVNVIKEGSYAGREHELPPIGQPQATASQQFNSLFGGLGGEEGGMFGQK